MEHRQNNTLAFCLFKYFPHGGQQRDMLLIAQACQARGYTIGIYTTQWEGPVPEGFEVHTAQLTAWTNHGRMRQYHCWLREQLRAAPARCVVGFSKVPGLDVYFAADSCYVERVTRRHGPAYRLTGRYRTYAGLEAALLGPASQTEILLISESQRAAFQKHYGTAAERMHLLPPWVAPDRKPPQDRDRARRAIRQELGLDEDTLLLVQIGSGFHTKGVDRTLRALAGLPRQVRTSTTLAVAGRSGSRGYRRLAVKLGIGENTRFLGERNDVMDLMAAADLMVHPARDEAAGVVLIEALICGLPVICSGICGHAFHIDRAQAGRVLPEPFDQACLSESLRDMLAKEKLATCRENALAWARSHDFQHMPQDAADIIEAVIRKKDQHAERG
ncbi:MAG: glycosyltransferase family 4 protein [Phycisphaerae bacterium]|nr:glycosyltransferase family 4 protein [Phycisphaerae bacterium]